MMKESFSCKSHPEKLLITHLKNSAEFCREGIHKLSFNGKDFISKKILEDIAYIIGFSHDIGKATSYFQEYLEEKDENRKRKLKSDERTNHGRLSSLFTFYLVKSYLEKEENTNCIHIRYLPYMALLAVLRHHGSPKNMEDEIRAIIDPENSREKKVLQDQVKSFPSGEIEKILENLSDKIPGAVFPLDLFSGDPVSFVEDNILRNAGRISRKLKRESSVDIFVLQQLLYSLLLQADKFDVIIDGGVEDSRKEIHYELLDEYRDKMGFDNPKTDINGIRNDIFLFITQRIDTLENDKKILSITLPTGSGKTIAAVGCALRLREKILRTDGFLPRIIYSLPFLGIIEQNHKVLMDILQNPGSDLMIKHHHLAEMHYKTSDDEMNVDMSEFMIEGWESEIIVTTFMQLFHSLITRRNRMIRKFHKIINSIVILDEIQSIPHKYWLVINRLLKELAGRWNTFFILMTATQPLIFSPDAGEITEIAPDNSNIYRKFKRVVLQNRTEDKLSLDEFFRMIEEDIEDNKEDSFLIILNTIKCCRKTYDFIKKLNPDNTRLYYLSTHITPVERLLRIKQIKHNKGRKIVISTQLVEAGVDIDLDRVYRDFAPMDSIAQSAGRCNRSGNRKKGTVILFKLLDENGKSFCEYIYDRFLLNRTFEVLSGKKIIDEPEFINLIEEYYQQVSQFKSNDKAKELIGMLASLRYKDFQKEFNLIEKQGPKTDVFIEIDNNAGEVWRRFEELFEMEDPLQKRKQFQSFKSEFYNYVVSIHQKYVNKPAWKDTEMSVINADELEIYYDGETGFILEDIPSYFI